MAKSDPIVAAIAEHKKAWRAFCLAASVLDSFPVELSRGPFVVVGQLIDGCGGPSGPVEQYCLEDIDAYFDDWRSRAIRGLGEGSEITRKLLARVETQRHLAHDAFQRDKETQQQLQAANGIDKVRAKVESAEKAVLKAERTIFATKPNTLRGASTLARYAIPFVKREYWAGRNVVGVLRCLAGMVR